MIPFILYLMISAVAGTVFNRFKSWKGWSQDSKIAACVFFGALWVFSVPMALCVVGMNKVLDKFTKV